MRMGHAPCGPRRQPGMTWLEFAVIAVLLSVLAGTLLLALQRTQALAEQATVELTIMNMRSGLRLRIAELIVAGREAEIGQLVDGNPVQWLQRPPAGYLGEAASAAALDEIPRGSWYFDRLRRELVFRVSREESFVALDGEEKLVRLHVAAAPGAPGAVRGVRIVETNRYAWQ